MWKARPVVATRVRGHQEQIQHRVTGLIVHDPTDLASGERSLTPAVQAASECGSVSSRIAISSMEPRS
jgi:hypothetical protein